MKLCVKSCIQWKYSLIYNYKILHNLKIDYNGTEIVKKESPKTNILFCRKDKHTQTLPFFISLSSLFLVQLKESHTSQNCFTYNEVKHYHEVTLCSYLLPKYSFTIFIFVTINNCILTYHCLTVSHWQLI